MQKLKTLLLPNKQLKNRGKVTQHLHIINMQAPCADEESENDTSIPRTQLRPISVVARPCMKAHKNAVTRLNKQRIWLYT